MVDTAHHQQSNQRLNNPENENCGCRLRPLSSADGLFEVLCNSAARIPPLRRDGTRPFPSQEPGHRRPHKVQLLSDSFPNDLSSEKQFHGQSGRATSQAAAGGGTLPLALVLRGMAKASAGLGRRSISADREPPAWAHLFIVAGTTVAAEVTRRRARTFQRIPLLTSGATSQAA